MGEAFVQSLEYYVEATNEDLQELIGRPDVVAENAEQVLEQANQWERKRIGPILQSELLDHYGPALIRETAAEYGVNIRTDRSGDMEKLVIPEDRRERRDLLRFLEEDYYRGPLTDTPYLANSKRAVRAGGYGLPLFTFAATLVEMTSASGSRIESFQLRM